MYARTALLLLAAVVGGHRPNPGAEPVAPRIVVAPDRRLSADDEVRHVETTIAANPRRGGNLLGAAMVLDQPTGTATYVSFDGGRTWSSRRFEEAWGDPQVAFTEAGTALFAALASPNGDENATALYVYRSGDGGITWQPPIDLGRGYDHPQVVVDRTDGKHSGRVYIGVLWGYPVYRIGVFRSDDDGRTWSGPVESANGGGEKGINVCSLIVLDDGTLFVPFIDFEFEPVKRWENLEFGIWSVVSSDGGLTFSASRRVATLRHAERPPVRFQGFPMFTAADARSPWPDRIFAAWNVMSATGPILVTAWSADAGKTWSEPTRLPQAASGQQWQPALAVNAAGWLGVTWYENEAVALEAPCSASSPCFHHYFTASLDGGLSFLPPARVSSAPSYTRWRLASGDRYGQGGDYMGLTTGRDGEFHSFWADSRSGSFQVYTAVVTVLR